MMKTINKILAVVAISLGIGLTTIQPIKANADTPSSYDYRISWVYRPSVSAYQLYGYTPHGGGIYELIYFTLNGNYYESNTSAFYGSEFTFKLKIPALDDNAELFEPYTLISGKYLYNSPDNSTISYYRTNTSTYMTLQVNCLVSDYYVTYMRDVNTDYNGAQYSSYTNEIFYFGGNNLLARNYVGNNLYNYFSTYSVSTYLVVDSGVEAGSLHTYTDAFYFKMVNTGNLEDNDVQSQLDGEYSRGWNDSALFNYDKGWDEGYIAGFAEGVASGETSGLTTISMIIYTTIGSISTFVASLSGFELLGVSLVGIIGTFVAVGIFIFIFKVIK